MENFVILQLFVCVILVKTSIAPLPETNFTSKNEEGSVERTKLIQLGNGSTLSNDSYSQPTLSGKTIGTIISTTLLVIDVIEVKKKTSDDLNDALHDDVIKEVPAWITGPLPLFILVISDDDRSVGITLDEISNKLQKEGFAVDKVIEDGKTQLIKLLDLVEATEKIPIKSKNFSNTLEPDTKIQKFDHLSSDRKKRSICVDCTIVIKKKNPNRGRRGGYRGACGGGCGRGGHRPQRVRPVYLQPVYQTVYQYPQQYYPQSVYQYPQQYHTQPQSPQQVQPVYQHPHPQPAYYPPQQQQYQPPQQCSTCGEGQSNAGGNAYAQATAQASASSTSGGYGR